MSLETIVSKMIAANEPESNIAKVIKYHKKDSSKINCKKCNHSWKVADGGDDLYMCHECGYNNNKSPLKAIECPEGFIDNEDGLGCVKISNEEISLTPTVENVEVEKKIVTAENPQTGTVQETTEVVDLNEEFLAENERIKSQRKALKDADEKEAIALVEKENLEAKKRSFEKGKFTKEQREEYKKFKNTGEITSSEQDAKEAVEKVASNKEKALYDFDSNMNAINRKYITNSIGVEKEKLKKPADELVTQVKENSLFLDKLGLEIEEAKKNNYDPEYLNEKIDTYNKVLADTQENSKVLNNYAVEYEDLNAMQAAYQVDFDAFNRISTTVKNTAVDVALGTMTALDMLKSEEGKEKSYSKDLLKIKKETTDYIENYLPKDLELKNVSTPADFARKAGSTFINFIPSLMAMGTGPAAMPLFFAMGAGGRLTEFAVADSLAKEQLPILKEKLKDKSISKEDKEIIEKQISSYDKDLNTSNLTKLVTAGLYGTAETFFEKYGSLAIINKAGKISGKVFKEGIADAISLGAKEIPLAMGRESISEGLTTLSQNAADIALTDKDINLFDGVDEAVFAGALTGGGLGLIPASSVARAATLDVISSKEEKQYIETTLSEIAKLELVIKDPNVSNTVKNSTKNKINEKVDEITGNQDIAIDRFLKLSQDQRQEVGELDRKSRLINKEWIAAAKDPSIDENTKKTIRETLESEFNDLQSKKRSIIESRDQRYKPLESIEGLEDGDLIRNEIQSDINLRSVKEHNKGAKWANKVLGITELDLKNINEFIKNEKALNITLEDNSVINKEDASLIVENEKDRNGFFDPNSKNIVVFTQRAPVYNKGTAIHEYIHAALDSQGFTEKQYNDIKDSLDESLAASEANGDITKAQKDQIINQIASYDGDPTQSKEILTAISDAINEDIITEKDTGFLRSLGDNIKETLKPLIGGEIVNEFEITDPAKSFEFVKTFNQKVLKGKRTGGKTGTAQDEEANEDILASNINLDGLLDKYGNKTTLIEQSLLKTPQGKETFDFTKSEFGESIGGLVETITKRLYDPVLPDLKRATSRDQFKQDLVSEAATIISNEFDPTKQELGKFITNRLNLRANRIASETFEQKITDDVTEAKAVSTDEKAADEVTKREPITEALNLKELKKSVDKNAELGIVKIENTLDNKDLSDLKKINAIRKSIGGLFERQYFKELSKVLGKNTKTSNDFSKYLNNNFETLSYAATNNIDFQKGNNIASDWNTNPPTKEEFIDYYEGKDILPSQPRSVKSDRKKSLINAVARQMANDALTSYVKENPKTAEIFKQKYQVPLASKITIPKNAIQIAENLPGYGLSKNLRTPAAGVANAILKKVGGELDFGSDDMQKNQDNINSFWNILDSAVAKNPSIFPKEIFGIKGIFRPSGRIFGTKRGSSKARANDKSGKLTEEYNILDNLNEKRFSDFQKKYKGKMGSLVNDAKGWKGSSYSTVFGKKGIVTEQSIKKAIKEGKADDFNKKNTAMHRQVWSLMFDQIKIDPNFAKIVDKITNTADATNNWHRFGAEFVAYSVNPKGSNKKLYEWEHAMQANTAKLFLLDAAVKKIPFNEIYNAVSKNYKLIALDKAYDLILGKANRGNSMGDNWNMFTDSYLSRYFSPEVVLQGGIDPKTIIGLNGESLATTYNIDSAGRPVIKPITTLKPIKKARIFDFDDTLAKTKSNVLYTLPNGKQGSLDATQFAEQFSKLQKAGATFDYSEFSEVKNGTKGPLADVAKKINDAKGDRDIFVLTARPANANVAIQNFLKEVLDINIPLENITGLADGKPSAKADWISQKVKEGYNNIFFADDVPANVKAVSDILNKSGVIKKVQVAKDAPKVLSSKSRVFYEDGSGTYEIESPLSREFNKMLERTKGVKAEAVYSDARASKIGSKKGFQFFVPYSAEDFLGLVYPTLGKNEQGDKDLEWWKDNVMTPYNDGMTNFESAKQAAMIEWNQIKDQIKETPANLGKKAVRDFSNEDAIRVYLWDQKGVVPDGLSKKDISALTKHVKDNPELQDFANQVAGLNINGYPDPTKGWLAGTITTDLVNHVNTSTRSEMLEPWQEAIDDIYTDDNKNKLRATYGDKYIEALDDALYRMKTGRNRPSGANRITNNWLNWVNDSVGTIMFLNQRSAILQTISSINFINWTDNNPAAAAKAFANQKQYWSDFTELFNSDFLKQRRSGLKTDVNADEIAQEAAGSTNKVRAGLSWLLKKGFLPTQIADSFAIASGGSTFYRNRINSLIKEGMSEADAKKQAFSDFRDSANESQQSSDPSRISMEQASSLGRVILAFANTPIQYTRLTKRAVQDLAAGRGDWKSNVSKILYYGAVQNIIFTTLQQAMFGMLFSDDDDEFQNDKKDTAVFNVANSTVDTFLRGSGVAGAFVAMLKNMALEIKKQSDKKTPDYTNVADKLFSVSPPIDSKFRKLKSAGRTFTYKQELEKIRNKGLAIDNPALMAAAQVISAFGNIPADRVLRKLNNIVESTNSENAIWQRIALAMGWGEWELGITDRKTKEETAERKSFQDFEKSISKVVKIREKEEAKEAKEDKKTPIKALEAGVLGEANRDGSIIVAKGLSKEKRKEVIRHEKVHQKEISSGKLDYDDNFVYYGKKKYERSNGKIMHNGKAKIEGDHSLPWEKVAHKH